jgi:hypothetical protein
VILRCGLSRGTEKRCGEHLHVFPGWDEVLDRDSAPVLMGACPKDGVLWEFKSRIRAAEQAGRDEWWLDKRFPLRVERGGDDEHVKIGRFGDARDFQLWGFSLRPDPDD